MNNHATIAPSILAADFARLGEEVQRVSPYVSMLHVDVMDGHFVPNISLGPPVIASLRAATDLYLDCHLMITDPLRYLEALAAAGANGCTAHIEAVPNPEPLFAEAETLGIDVGLVVNPATPVTAVEPYLESCSMVVIMSVQPGFGGQTFMPEVLDKVETLRETVDSHAFSTDIQVDGGIDLQSIGRAHTAGANVLVAGTSVFRADDPAAAVQAMKAIVNAGAHD